jgi:hypothetical protein
MALLGEMGSSEHTRRRQDQGQVGCTGQQPRNCHGMETDIQWTLVNPALVNSGPPPNPVQNSVHQGDQINQSQLYTGHTKKTMNPIAGSCQMEQRSCRPFWQR